jgi:hypothetical protein
MIFRVSLKSILFLGVFFIKYTSMAQEIFVAPHGSDAAIGSSEYPFATLQRAVDEVQKRKLGGITDKMTISLREGKYQMQKTIALDSAFANLIIRAYPGEAVVLSGGVSIPVHLLEQQDYDSGQIRRYRVDLKKAGITDYGSLRNVGFSRPYGTAWGELFVNKKPMHLSRWPNKGMVSMGKVLDKGSIPRNDDFANRGGTMKYEDSRIHNWVDEKDPWMAGYFMWGYADDMVKIADVNIRKNTITTASATLYGFGYGEPWRQWYGINILAELDESGEYYVDREMGILHFMSDEKSIESLVFSILEDPFFTLSGSSNVTIKGVTFECSRGIGLTMDNTRNVTIKGCTFRNLGSVGVSVGKGIEPFKEYRHEGSGQAKSGIVGSLQQHNYANSTFNREGGQDNTIISCHFYNLGAGGVVLGGGDRLSLEAGNNVVENCIFHDLNRVEKSYRPAVYLTGVGNIVRHCEIYNTPSMAIYIMFGNDHVIEYNYFHNVCVEAEDQGAIYYGRNPTELGNVVRYNYFENIPDHYRTCAVYHDDGACGMTVYGNVFYKAGYWNVLLGGGSDNTYQNNIFIGNKHGLHVDNRLQNWSKSLIEKGGLFEKRLKAVNYTLAPYSTHYPQLSTYMDKVALPTGNLVENNVFVQVQKLLSGEMEWLDYRPTNLVLNGDPGFEDAGANDFRLRPDAEIYKKLPQFKEIPFHKMGTYESVDLPVQSSEKD